MALMLTEMGKLADIWWAVRSTSSLLLDERLDDKACTAN